MAGTGGPTLSFEWPAGVELSLESVYVDVDASGAGGPVTGLLTISDTSGVVIAKKRQSETMDAANPVSATWALRNADDGGGSTGAALKTTDGTHTVNPTTELRIGRGLGLTNPGAGIAGIAGSAVPYVCVQASGFVVPAGGFLIVNFHPVGGFPSFTNDIPAAPGYKTDQGAAFTNNTTWVGDYFRGNVAAATSAFRAQVPPRGLYIVDVEVTHRVFGGGGNLSVTVNAPNNALGSAGASFPPIPFVAAQAINPRFTFAYLAFSGGAANADFGVTLAHTAGFASSGPDASCQVACYRVSPS